jgi:hypothetical protein
VSGKVTGKREGGRGKEGGRGRRKREEEEEKRKRAGPGAGGARAVCPKRAEAEEASYSPGPYM